MDSRVIKVDAYKSEVNLAEASEAAINLNLKPLLTEVYRAIALLFNSRLRPLLHVLRYHVNPLGGDAAGKHIYNRGSANGKRVQCNMGAKNHGVIMPDANKEYTINQLVGAAFGAAGQRCMALTTAVMVGDSKGGDRRLESFPKMI